MSSSRPDNAVPPGPFEVRLARDAAEVAAAQRLRYEVFVTELGGDGVGVDHAAGLERDRFDPFCEHMIVRDLARPDAPVIATYRLMTQQGAARAGGFYTAGEYDLAPLVASGRPLLELGRSCLRREYRGGAAMYHLWHGLAAHTLGHGIEVLFGVASFHGTDIDALAPTLSHLHHRFRAPPDLRVTARTASARRMDILPQDAIDAAAALRQVPALIKAYLRLGGVVGDGAFVDHAFNTTDICLILDIARMNARQRAIYARGLDA